MKKTAGYFLRGIEIICIGLLILMVLVIGLQIICRTFSIGISWTEELARLAFCVIAFLGTPLVFAEGSHIAVDMLVNSLPQKARNVAEVLIHIIMGAFSIFGIRSCMSNSISYAGVTAVSMTWLKINWIYGIVGVSSAFILVICFVRIINVFRGGPLTLNIHEGDVIEEEELDLGI